jgi:hypothetical protein
MTDEPKNIQITLTKEFHTKYWDARLTSIKWTLVILSFALVILITGLIFNAIPKFTLLEMIIISVIYCTVGLASFTLGIHYGVRLIGLQINKRIHEEHPELFPNLEKKEGSDVEKKD